MKILTMQSFTGRNIYSSRPVIKVTMDIEHFELIPTNEIEGFNERLLKLLPGLYTHHCSRGYEGGFVERLKEGTYMGHVLEHLLIELQRMNGYDVYFGKTRTAGKPGLYYIVFETMNEQCGFASVKAAVSLLDRICMGDDVDLNEVLKRLQEVSRNSELGPTTRALYQEAKRRGIPVTRIGSESILQLGYGKCARRIEASLTDKPSCVTVDIVSNKHLTKQILKEHKIPVPHGFLAYSEEEALSIAEEIGFPVVLKPYNSNKGNGVAINIVCREQLITAYVEARKFGDVVIVERYIKGRDFRVLVVGDKVAAVAERKPPSVVGDGVHSVKELLAIENQNPLRGVDHEKPLTKIPLDHTSCQVLAKQGLDESTILPKGKIVALRENGNLSTGGNARNCTDEIHPMNALLAVNAAKAVGLDIAGIDIIAEDISIPVGLVKGAVVEVNAAPGLRMHLYPSEGASVDIAAIILEFLYPNNMPSSIPIISVTGTNGKTTTTRLIRHVITLLGKKVGMTSTSGIYIGEECIMKGDNTGPLSAGLVLSNQEVEVAVLETARGGIVKRGLGYDLADIGIITNVSEDHLGIDGINTIEELAFVKALVGEAVKETGHVILNADDKMTDYFISRVKSKIVLFSMDANNAMVQEHVCNSGIAVCVENNEVFLYENLQKQKIIHIDQIPITLGGLVECNVENALAAICALYVLQIPIETIELGLKTFMPDPMLNPGRFNIFDMGNFKVMLDYGHNLAGFSCVLKFIKKVDAKRLIGIIGVPGDRLDKSILESGRVCGNIFSKVYIKEDNELRGREQGEVATLLEQALIEAGDDKENIKIIYNEVKALESAILDARPGDFIVMFYEEFEPALFLINKLKSEERENGIPHENLFEEIVG